MRFMQPDTAAPIVPRPVIAPAPLLVPALGFVAGIVLGRLDLPSPGAAAVALISLAVLLAGRAARGGTAARTTLVCIGSVAAIAGLARFHALSAIPADDVSRALGVDDQLARIRGMVVTAPSLRPPEIRNAYLPTQPPPARVEFVLAAESTCTTPATRVSGLVQVHVIADSLAITPGDEVEVTGWLSRVHGARNPGEPDWAEIAARSGIRSRMSVESPRLVRSVGRGSAPRRYFAAARAWVRASLLGALPPDAEGASRLLDALVLGQRSAVERSVDDAFKRIGAVHFLSVSGFHVGVLAGSIYWLVRSVLRRGARTAALAMGAAIIAYALLAEPNSPIIRAAVVGVLACVGVLIGRRMAFLNWLSLAVIVVLAWNPLDLFSAGFQLSFLLALALLTVVHAIERSFRNTRGGDVPQDAETRLQWIGRKTRRFLVSLVLINLVCWAISVPLVLHHFGMFTPWAAIQAIPLTPCIVFITIFGFVVLAVGAVWPAGAALLGPLLARAAGGLTAAADWLARIPGSAVECTPPPAWFAWCTYGLVAAALLLWFRQPVVRRFVKRLAPQPIRQPIALALIVAALLAWIGWAALPAVRSAGAQLDVLAVGNGSAALLTTHAGGAAVFDCGSLQNFDAGAALRDAARLRGVRGFDLIAISHANLDHFSGIPALLDRYPARRLAAHPAFAADAARSPATRKFLAELGGRGLSALAAGDRFDVGDCRATVLWPPPQTDPAWDENDRSLVIRLEYAGRRILLPGDASQIALAALRQAHAAGAIDLRAEVLIAPHHGAVVDATADFYRAAAPQWVIVSNSRHRARLDALLGRDFGAPVPRLIVTGRDGCAQVTIGPTGDVSVTAPFASE